jgi:hypothetical protein
MDEIIIEMFGTLKSLENSITASNKAFRKQTRTNRLFGLFIIGATGYMYHQSLKIAELTARVAKVEEQTETVPKGE